LIETEETKALLNGRQSFTSRKDLSKEEKSFIRRQPVFTRKVVKSILGAKLLQLTFKSSVFSCKAKI
jgi:hypothetical protein